MSDEPVCDDCGQDGDLHHVGDDRYHWDCMDTREQIEHGLEDCPICQPTRWKAKHAS